MAPFFIMCKFDGYEPSKNAKIKKPVGWVEARNPTSLPNPTTPCWVSLRSTQPTRLQQAQAARPELDVRNIVPPGSYHGEDRLRIEGQGSDLLLRDRVNYAAVATDGNLIETGSGADLTAFEYWVNMADPLHFGDFAGITSKLIWFIFGLLLSGLILTGTWLHAQRLAREAGGRSRHRWPGTAAALVVSLVVLAASVPYGLGEAHSYGPIVNGVQQFPVLAPGVKAVIIGWVALTLAIIAAWVWLLWRFPTLKTT